MEGKPQVVTIPNGTQFRVEIIGTVRLKNGVILKNVLYVPKFCFNLISVSKLIRDLNCNVIFNANECLIQESLMKKHLLLGKAKHALYFLQDYKSDQHQKDINVKKYGTQNSSSL